MNKYTCSTPLYGVASLSAINVQEAARKYLLRVGAGKGLWCVDVHPEGSKTVARVTQHWSRPRRVK